MTWGTMFVLAVLLVIVFLAVHSMVKDRRAGKRSCGGSCSACSGCSCGHHNYMSDEEILELAKRAAAERNG